MIDNKSAPYGILALRVTTGALFLFHGLVKLFVFTPAGTAGYFESIGLPGALGYLTLLVEIVGGLALILGVKARLVSLALVPVLLGAAYFGHGAFGFNWSNPNGGWEYPVMWAVVQAALAALGDGAYALVPSNKQAPRVQYA
ncbi:DoxX family protein [Aliigemmobacter aestuarii]|uniref:DoxX family protein n=1 Tax=Aliigemmobacter aestuarii TaxID=1445661 RepID=A0A4S3MP37_9RHOB|nr:DoxX family protein [Gemmobacter aestuarii]THD83814.1 DoxX family protein [Gemmobacter aestuarii]